MLLKNYFLSFFMISITTSLSAYGIEDKSVSGSRLYNYDITSLTTPQLPVSFNENIFYNSTNENIKDNSFHEQKIYSHKKLFASKTGNLVYNDKYVPEDHLPTIENAIDRNLHH